VVMRSSSTINIATCCMRVCSPLSAPRHGQLLGSDVSHGSTVTASCQPGFMFPDGNLSTHLQCVSNGSPTPEAVWSASVADCQRTYAFTQYVKGKGKASRYSITLRPVQPSRVECRHRAARISGRISDAFSPSTYTKARHLSPGHLFLNADYKGKRSPYTITERRVPELIPVLGSQPAGDVSHKPGGRLPLLSARPAVTLATLKRAATSFAAW